MFFGVRQWKSWHLIRDAVLTKGKHYGDMDYPLIVAINAGGLDMKQIDVMQALFGKEQFI